MYGFILNIGFEFNDGETIMFPRYLYVGDGEFIECYPGKPLDERGKASKQILAEGYVGLYVNEADFFKVNPDKIFILVCDPISSETDYLEDEGFLMETETLYNEESDNTDDSYTTVFVTTFVQNNKKMDTQDYYDDCDEGASSCACGSGMCDDEIDYSKLPKIDIITSN